MDCCFVVCFLSDCFIAVLLCRNLLGNNHALRIIPLPRHRRWPQRWTRFLNFRTCQWRSRRMHPNLHLLMLGFPLFELLGQVFEAKILGPYAFGHDAIVERYVGCPAALLAHFERRCRLLADIESFGVAVGREEYVILRSCVYGLRKGGVEDDSGSAAT